MKKVWIVCLLLAALLLASCGADKKNDTQTTVYHSADHMDAEAASWSFGFGVKDVVSPVDPSGKSLYMGGYNSGWYARRYLDLNTAEEYLDVFGRTEGGKPDYCQARAIWMDTGAGGVLLIGIDAVALSHDVVNEIRSRLKDLCAEKNCVSVNVYSTHDHAGPDTLGLWGPIGVDGKDKHYMEALITAAVEAAQEAAESRRSATLYYGQVETKYILQDSRIPHMYDDKLYQLRFEAEEGAGARLLFFGAHAESMRGDNRLLSRDFPGMMCDFVKAETGDDAMFLPGAIGGLIMTTVPPGEFSAVDSLQRTARTLADYVLQIKPEDEVAVAPSLSVAKADFTAPLDNSMFVLFKMLGIFGSDAVETESGTGYGVRTEMSILQLGDLTVALLPGEIFPELVMGIAYGDAGTGENPAPLKDIAKEFGCDKLLIVGLANDEIGYIVSPSDFLVNEQAPYLLRTVDYKNEDHYEETNSVGPMGAIVIAETFETLLSEMQ